MFDLGKRGHRHSASRGLRIFHGRPRKRRRVLRAKTSLSETERKHPITLRYARRTHQNGILMKKLLARARGSKATQVRAAVYVWHP